MSSAEQEIARMAAFDRFSRDEQIDVIRRMAAEGVSEYSIAAATRLSVEQVRLVVGRCNVRR